MYMYIYRYTMVRCPVVVPTPVLVGRCVCVSNIAGADSDWIFSSALPSGTFAADRSQTIVKYFSQAAKGNDLRG